MGEQYFANELILPVLDVGNRFPNKPAAQVAALIEWFRRPHDEAFGKALFQGQDVRFAVALPMKAGEQSHATDAGFLHSLRHGTRLRSLDLGHGIDHGPDIPGVGLRLDARRLSGPSAATGDKEQEYQYALHTLTAQRRDPRDEHSPLYRSCPRLSAFIRGCY